MKPKKIIAAILLSFLLGSLSAQEVSLSTEVQSTFIDITGLFGVDEPASATKLSYKSEKGFGLDMYHSFSIEDFGQTVQTIAIPSYTFRLSEKLYIKPKADFAYIATSGGTFVRPGALLIWKANNRNTFSYGNWFFRDTRSQEEYPNRLNGFTYFSSYHHSMPLKKWKLDFETRLAFVDITDVFQLSALFQNVTLKHNGTGIYVGANSAYSFYHSQGMNDLIWNVTIGKSLILKK